MNWQVQMSETMSCLSENTGLSHIHIRQFFEKAVTRRLIHLLSVLHMVGLQDIGSNLKNQMIQNFLIFSIEFVYLVQKNTAWVSGCAAWRCSVAHPVKKVRIKYHLETNAQKQNESIVVNETPRSTHRSTQRQERKFFSVFENIYYVQIHSPWLK